jgi:hypothetical protein
MRKTKKYFLWTAGFLGALLVLLLVTLFLLPHFINLEPMRKKIETAISQQIGEQVKFQRVDFSFFPRPRVIVHQARVSIPEKVSVALETLTIAPEIIPLLQGQVRISLVRAEFPTLTLELAGESPEKAKSVPFSPAIIQEELAPLMKLMQAKVPQLTIEVEKGRLSLLQKKQPVFWFQDIQGRITLPPDQLRMDLTCKSNLWGHMSLAARLSSKDLNGSVNIRVTDIHPRLLLNYLVPATFPFLEESQGNLEIRLEVDRGKAFRGKIQASSPSLTFHRGEKKWDVKGLTINGAFQMQEDKATIYLTELSLQNPRSNLSGELNVDLAAPFFRLELACREMDVAPVREIAMGLAGDTKPVRTIFGMLRGGKIPYISFKTNGRSLADLGDLKNILIQGEMVGGRIFLPGSLTKLKGVDFDLKDVQGQVNISRGILEVKNLAVQWEKSRVFKGLLKLSLGGENDNFHVEATADVDLTQLPPFLKKLIGDRTFSEEIARFQELQGRVLARLTLGETLKSIQPRIEVQQLRLLARYNRIPYLLKVESAQGAYDRGKIIVKNLKGTIGQSSFSEISAQINLRGTPYILVPSGKSSIVLDEIYAWLNSIEKLKAPLQDIRSLKGTVALSSINLKGPLTQPKKWDYHIGGKIEKLAMEASIVPGLLSVTAAKFEVNPGKIRLQDSQVNLLDASLKVSAAWNGWQQGPRSVEGSFYGNLGTKVIEWSSTRLQLPANWRIQAPLSISQARLGWKPVKGFSFVGNCQWPEGPGVIIDLLYTPEELTVNRLLITDDRSQANIGLKFQQKELRLDFKGNLEKTTVDRILIKNEFLAGSIRGDFRSHIFIDNLLRSTAQGKLAGAGLGLALPIKLPLILERFSLDAEKNKIRVHSAALRWEDRHLTMGGSVDFSSEAFLVDMDISIDGLQWEKIEKILKTGDPKTQLAKAGKTARRMEPSRAKKMRFPPLRGRIGIKSKYFEYGRYTWRPLVLEISFPAEEVKVTITEANVCGISTTGTVRVNSGNIALDFQALAKNQEISSTAQCLSGKPNIISGDLNFYAQVKGQGQSKDLASSLQGSWHLEARDGRVYRESIFMKIFGFLRLTENSARDQTDLTKGKGEMSYKSLQAKGDLYSGKLFIKELALNASVMGLVSQGEIDFLHQRIDFVVLVAPLKQVNWIVKHIPIIGYILGGTLVSLPVRVHGDLNAPKIIPLDPSVIGSNLMGIMKRTLKLPFKVTEPIFQEPEKLKEQPSRDPSPSHP